MNGHNEEIATSGKTLREHCAEIGRKGGMRHTRKQIAAHRRAIKIAQRVRSQKARQRRLQKAAEDAERHGATETDMQLG
jgi:hypothetical protein